ncbi:hypothetical protein OUZ56_028287 [Daphnia magna]|uniref:Uncharacterized protein n=1 Tax=Daphnia magna TaxID=35525 RepID=A0ABR0B3E3_9CRUS|nr:hypothetical protein OUZ56_028287 [Daphnia magna]
MTTTPVRVQVPGLNLQQEIGSSIRYTSATCLTHSVATPSQYYLIKQRYNFIKITVINCEFPLMGIRVVVPVPKPDIITVYPV